MIQRYRSAFGAAESLAEEHRLVKTELEENLADIKAMVHLGKGSVVDVSKLNEKVILARLGLSEEKLGNRGVGIENRGVVTMPALKEMG